MNLAEDMTESRGEVRNLLFCRDTLILQLDQFFRKMSIYLTKICKLDHMNGLL